jgi:hypothetical protein
MLTEPPGWTTLGVAVATAYDPNGFNERVHEGRGLIGTEQPAELPWRPSVPGAKYNLDQAKKLVTQAKPGPGTAPYGLLFSNSLNDAAASLALETTRKAAGINVVVDNRCADRDDRGREETPRTR